MQPKIPEGYEARVYHLRVFANPLTGEPSGVLMTRGQARMRGVTEPPLSKGGITVVEIISPAGHMVSTDTAACSPLDNYSKSKGRLIATGRALKKCVLA